MRGLRRVGVGVVGAIIASGLTAFAAPSAQAAETIAPMVEPAPVTPNPVAEKPRPPAPTDHDDPAWLNPTVTLPATDTVDVTMSSTGRAKAGMLPVEVGPAVSGLTPGKVRVRMMGQSEVTAAGGQFLGFQLLRADGGASPATVSVAVDYSGITHAIGGDFTSRLRLTRTRCQGCDAAKLTGTNDFAGKKLVLDVPVEADPDAALTLDENVATAPAPDSGFGPQITDTEAVDALSPSSLTGGTTFMAMADAGGAGGNYAASPIAGASTWQVGVGSGAMTYNYPIDMPPAVAGPAPSLTLDYNSQVVDGRTTETNNQVSMVGEGWNFEPGYIERRFHSCANDTGGTADLCWSPSNEYYLSFGGQSGEIVKNGASNEWRLRGNDPAWRILSYTGAPNGDDNGEYFVVITPDGAKYWFGSGTEPAQSGSPPVTNAAYTVPVVAGVNEPCYSAVGLNSWCQQAYRWNVDRVRDRNDNVTSYFYTKELNYYARQNQIQTQYTRSGYLTRVEYGKRNGAESTNEPARAVVSASLRCLAQSSCPTPSMATASSYPDVPMDRYCPTSTTCTVNQDSPTFFSVYDVSAITTYIWNSAVYVPVSTYALTYNFPTPGDGTSASLWLHDITKTGNYGTVVSLPPVTFGGTPLQNRVNTGQGIPALIKYRLWYIDAELGARITATYGTPHPCPLAPSYPAFDNNPYDCYPALYNGVWIPFRKYLVTSVLTENTGGQPDQRVDYDYQDTPAWHYQDSILAGTEQSWSDYRGHARVLVTADDGGTTARTRTEYLLFRGMNGDKLANGTSKSVTLQDSFGFDFADNHYLAGMPLEVRRFALDGTTFESTLHRYWAVMTIDGPDGWMSHNTQYVRESALIPRTKDTTTQSSWITREIDTTYSTFSGMPTQVVEQGDTGVSGDETCTKNEYTDFVATSTTSPNNAEWYLGLPYRNTTYGSSACSGTIAAKTETYYDGHATLGAVPSAGNVTQVDAYPDATTKSTTKTTYDSYGRVLTSKSPNQSGGSAATTTVYTPSTGYPGTSIAVTDALGHTTSTLLYFSWGTPKTVTDANGDTTRITADGLGRTTEVFFPDDPTTPSLKYAYALDSAAPNKITASTLQSGTTYVNTYTYLDGLARPIETQSPPPNNGDTGRIISMIRYDAQGRKAAQSQPMPATGTPGSGQVNPTPTSIPNETRYTYDSGGRQNAATQYALGASQWSTHTAWYGPYRTVDYPVHSDVKYYTDVFGRTTRVDEFPTTGTITTNYGYTRLGDLATITDDAGHQTTYGHDWLRRRTTASDPDTGSSSTTYDADGNVTKTTDAKTKSLFSVYDILDRKTDTYLGVDATGTKVAHWDYDTAPTNGVGRLHKATSYVGGVGGAAYVTEATGYDVRGRASGKKWTIPAAEGVPAGTFTYNYAYDKADRMTTLSMPAAGLLAAEDVTTGFNVAGLPVTLSGAGTSYVSATTYRDDGRLASRTINVGAQPTTRDYTYDTAAGRLASLKTIRNGVTVEDVTYGYDADSNVTSVADLVAGVGTTRQRECFGYDPINRLTAAYTTDSTTCAAPNHGFGTDPYDQSFGYDDLGDITSATDNMTATTKTYTYNVSGHAHAVGSVGSGNYTYDPNGATLTRPSPGATTLTWNDLHQLDTATDGTTTTHFVYDADGNRLIRNDGTTAMVYLDDMEIAYTGANTSATRYYGGVAMRDNASALTVLLRNNQNSATVTVDAAGTVSHQRYLPYGGHRGTTGSLPGTQRGFLDKTEDATGLDAVGARYYDATIGRFTSVDALGDAATPQSFAGYSYALGNPVTFSDPSGLRPCSNPECDDHGDSDDSPNWTCLLMPDGCGMSTTTESPTLGSSPNPAPGPAPKAKSKSKPTTNMPPSSRPDGRPPTLAEVNAGKVGNCVIISASAGSVSCTGLQLTTVRLPDSFAVCHIDHHCSATVNAAAANAFQNAIDEVAAKGLGGSVTQFGTYAPRACHAGSASGSVGSGCISKHSYGLAVDFRPWIDNSNWDSVVAKDPGVMKVVRIFQSHGFYWGGLFSGNYDPQHLEWVNRT